MMRATVLLGLLLLLTAQAPTPPEPPLEKQAESAPAPPEKPETLEKSETLEKTETSDEAEAEAVPVPTEKPPEADQTPEAAADVEGSEPPTPEEEEEAKPEEASPEPGDKSNDASGSTGADNAAVTGAAVPLPPEMPEEVEEAQEQEAQKKQESRPLVSDTTEPVAEAACRIRLKKLPVEWELQEPLRENRCGIGRGIRVTKIAGVELLPAAMLNCRTTEALALWVRDDVMPAAEENLEDAPTSLLVAGSYVCRSRNGRAGARLSEHAFGNAVDVAGFVFGDDTMNIEAQDPKQSPARLDFQKEIRKAACERFTTVLGPGTDASHKTHFHFDLRTRSSGYRLCQ